MYSGAKSGADLGFFTTFVTPVSEVFFAASAYDCFSLPLGFSAASSVFLGGRVFFGGGAGGGSGVSCCADFRSECGDDGGLVGDRLAVGDDGQVGLF